MVESLITPALGSATTEVNAQQARAASQAAAASAPNAQAERANAPVAVVDLSAGAQAALQSERADVGAAVSGQAVDDDRRPAPDPSPGYGDVITALGGDSGGLAPLSGDDAFSVAAAFTDDPVAVQTLVEEQSSASQVTERGAAAAPGDPTPEADEAEARAIAQAIALAQEALGGPGSEPLTDTAFG